MNKREELPVKISKIPTWLDKLRRDSSNKALYRRCRCIHKYMKGESREYMAGDCSVHPYYDENGKIIYVCDKCGEYVNEITEEDFNKFIGEFCPISDTLKDLYGEEHINELSEKDFNKFIGEFCLVADTLKDLYGKQGTLKNPKEEQE